VRTRTIDVDFHNGYVQIYLNLDSAMMHSWYTHTFGEISQYSAAHRNGFDAMREAHRRHIYRLRGFHGPQRLLCRRCLTVFDPHREAAIGMFHSVGQTSIAECHHGLGHDAIVYIGDALQNAVGYL
jgi:hypothetical protein